jgi:hypothetical protein
MILPKKTWREKRLVKEEGNSSGDSSVSDTETDERAATQKNADQEEGQLQQGVTVPKVPFEVNMVFVIPGEFRAPETEVAELNARAARVVFDKPVRLGEHMKPLYIKGHLDGARVGCMMVDGVASVNILPLFMFKKLGHTDCDLKQTNMSLSGFSGELAEAKGIVSKELTVGSKTVPTTFFVVDVKG